MKMGGNKFKLTQSQEMELDRCLKEFDANPEMGLPWEKVIARIRKNVQGGKKGGTVGRRRKID